MSAQLRAAQFQSRAALAAHTPKAKMMGLLGDAQESCNALGSWIELLQDTSSEMKERNHLANTCDVKAVAQGLDMVALWMVDDMESLKHSMESLEGDIKGHEGSLNSLMLDLSLTGGSFSASMTVKEHFLDQWDDTMDHFQNLGENVCNMKDVFRGIHGGHIPVQSVMALARALSWSASWMQSELARMEEGIAALGRDIGEHKGSLDIPIIDLSDAASLAVEDAMDVTMEELNEERNTSGITLRNGKHLRELNTSVTSFDSNQLTDAEEESVEERSLSWITPELRRQMAVFEDDSSDEEDMED